MNTSSPLPAVAFLGLGIMGSGMARRLAGAGFPLRVYNRSADKAKPLAEAGAVVAETPALAAKDADIIVSMLADDDAARALWLGRDGALVASKPTAICIECSTVTLDWVNELSSAALQAGREFLDAPVTGSRVQAEAGELSFLVGGAAATLEKVQPVLRSMGRTVVHLGGIGSGATVKLVNNFVCGVQVAALAQALTMIERSGIRRDAALDVLTQGAPGSPLVKAVSARMTAADYRPNFHVQLMAKDLRYAIHEAEKQRVSLTTAAAALKIFEQAVATGHGDRDIAAVIEPMRK